MKRSLFVLNLIHLSWRYKKEHKKAKRVNKNVGATIIHNEYKDALSNEKCIRQSVNRLQTKDDRIGTCKINKNFTALF